jgi:hypothetical protein
MSAADSGSPSEDDRGSARPARDAAGRDALAAEIDRARARVAASLNTLGDEVARRGDWRAWIRARPTLVITGAFVLGFLLGGGGGPPRSNT